MHRNLTFKKEHDIAGTSRHTLALMSVCVLPPLGVGLRLSHTHIGLSYGLILIFQRTSPSLSYGSPPGRLVAFFLSWMSTGLVWVRSRVRTPQDPQ